MNTELIADVVTNAEEFAEMFIGWMDDQFQGAPYGQKAMREDVFMMWFMQQTMANPNWLAALPFVEGGKDVLGRAERIVLKAYGAEAA